MTGVEHSAHERGLRGRGNASTVTGVERLGHESISPPTRVGEGHDRWLGFWPGADGNTLESAAHRLGCPWTRKSGPTTERDGSVPRAHPPMRCRPNVVSHSSTSEAPAAACSSADSSSARASLARSPSVRARPPSSGRSDRLRGSRRSRRGWPPRSTPGGGNASSSGGARRAPPVEEHGHGDRRAEDVLNQALLPELRVVALHRLKRALVGVHRDVVEPERHDLRMAGEARPERWEIVCQPQALQDGHVPERGPPRAPLGGLASAPYAGEHLARPRPRGRGPRSPAPPSVWTSSPWPALGGSGPPMRSAWRREDNHPGRRCSRIRRRGGSRSAPVDRLPAVSERVQRPGERADGFRCSSGISPLATSSSR